MRNYTDEQINLALAFQATTAEYQTAQDPELVYDKLKKTLTLSPATKGNFDTIVYGPATLRLPHSPTDVDYDDYMFFVVQQTNDENNYKLVIRSTTSTLNALEDIEFLPLVSWKDYDSQAPEDALISKGMYQSIGDLISMVSNNKPGEGKTIVEFFEEKVSQAGEKGQINLTVCGHSYSGIVAPLMGLYLNSSINNKDRFNVNVYSAAATTIGNAQFASYAEKVLGNKLKRVANELDGVTKPWSIEGLEELKTLYEPQIVLDQKVKILISGLQCSLNILHVNYTHTNPAETFTGDFNEALTNFMDQWSYQHDFGYLNYYDLKMLNLDDHKTPTDEDIIIFTSK